MTFTSKAFPEIRYGFWKPPHSLITLAGTLTSLLLSWSFSYRERSTEQDHSAQDQEGGGWVPIPRGPWRMAGLGTAFWGEKKSWRGWGSPDGAQSLGRQSVCARSPRACPWTRGAAWEMPESHRYHTLPRKAPPVGQTSQGTPNRRHSLLSRVSISPDRSTVEPQRVFLTINYFHLLVPGHRSSPQQLPTCRHTLASALLESPKTWSPPLEPSMA